MKSDHGIKLLSASDLLKYSFCFSSDLVNLLRTCLSRYQQENLLKPDLRRRIKAILVFFIIFLNLLFRNLNF